MVTPHVLLAWGTLPRPIRGEPKVTVTEGGTAQEQREKELAYETNGKEG